MDEEAARIPLDGAWTLAYGPADEAVAPDAPELGRWPAIPARVPGNIEIDLTSAGLIADPRVGDAAWAVRAWEDRDWWYRRRFELPASLIGSAIELVCEGLDCFAEVWINGMRIGASSNALITQRFAASGALRAGTNEIAIRIASAVREGRRRVPTASEFHTHAFGWESLAVRKPPHQYGWDILPRLALGGIYRPIRLEVVPPVRLREVLWSTRTLDAAARSARVVVRWDAALPPQAISRWRWRLRLSRGSRPAWSHEAPVSGAHGHVAAALTDIEPWWPRGWGEPALYAASIELIDDQGTVRARDERRIGLRTVELRRAEADSASDGDFGLVVNGERLFARGTNWVPLDALHARDQEHRAATLDLLWRSGSNVVRMWGGNRYEDDAVFDWCDEHGILIWQDFALACAVYPQGEEMRAALAEEAAQVIRRLRNHPCLGLWCGGNETDEAHLWAGVDQDPDSDVLSREVLADAVRLHDPLRPYLPSSPYLSRATRSSGVAVEAHLWGARDDWLSPYFVDTRASFIGEMGWHGCPAPASLARMQPPGTELFPVAGNPLWLPQAVCATAEDRAHAWMLDLVGRQAALVTCDPLDTLDAFTVASQTAQAEALKTWIEVARARKGRMWGLLWWNLRDGWPVITNSIVDYFGNRKLAFPVVAAAQAEVVVLVERARDGWHRVLAVNDRLQPARLAIRIEDEDGSALLSRQLEVPANAVAEVGVIAEIRTHALWIARWSGDAEGANHFLAGPRPWRLADLRRWYARLGLRADGFAAALSAR
jgi:beta-mannosidase